ncbi:MAG: hypothetical protein QM626_04550 [Microbacterium sp.]
MSEHERQTDQEQHDDEERAEEVAQEWDPPVTDDEDPVPEGKPFPTE